MSTKIMDTSPLASTFDIVASVLIDYMHAIFKEATCWLMITHFASKFHTGPYSTLVVMSNEL